MNIRLREFSDLKALPAEPTPEDLALLAGPDYAGEKVGPEAVRVRQMLLAHDQYDRTYERFPRTYLDRFAETLPGKSLLPGHDKSELPLGRFFRAGLDKRREEFPTLVQGGKDADDGEIVTKGAEPVPGFEPRTRSVTYLQAGFYYPNDSASEPLDNRIKLGVYRSVSIGFKFDDLNCDICRKSYFRDCPHLAGEVLEEGKVVTLTYAGDAEKAEALEGSIVFLGAQPQARIIKAMVEAGAVDPQQLAYTPFGEDLVALKYGEHLARRYGHVQKSWSVGTVSGNVTGVVTPAVCEQGVVDIATYRTLVEIDEAVSGGSALLKVSASGEVDNPAPAGVGGTDDPAAVAVDKESDMSKLLEVARKTFGLPEDAAEDAAIAAFTVAADDLKAAQEKAARFEGVDLDSLKSEAEKVKQLEPDAAIGTQALADLAKEYVDHCIRLEQPEVEAQAVADLFTTRKDYAGLKNLVSAKWEQICKRYPAGPSGNPRAGLDEPTAPVGRPVEYSLV